jgi:hypothetical protein
MENTSRTKKKRRKSNALKNQSGKPPSRMIVVGVKFHTVSNNTNNAEAMEADPTENASLSMPPETVSDRLDEDYVYNDRSY